MRMPPRAASARAFLVPCPIPDRIWHGLAAACQRLDGGMTAIPGAHALLRQVLERANACCPGGSVDGLTPGRADATGATGASGNHCLQLITIRVYYPAHGQSPTSNGSGQASSLRC